MIKLFLGAATAALLTVALPSAASAQDGSPSIVIGPGGQQGIHQQLVMLEARIDEGLVQGKYTPDEAYRARHEVYRIDEESTRERGPDGGPLSAADHADLQAKIDRLRDTIRWDRPSSAAMPEAWSLERREHWMGERLQRATDAGGLSGNESEHGRLELNAIQTEQARLVERDGGAISEIDRAYLNRRIDELNNTLKWEGDNPPPPWSRR